MKRKYEEIDFRAFTKEFGKSGEAEHRLTDSEKARVLETFYDSIGETPAAEGRRDGGNADMEKRIWKKGKGRHRGLVAAACLCLIVTASVTPVGERVWASAKEAFKGIGAFLHQDSADDFTTLVNQTQSRNGIHVTLYEAWASDRNLSYSVIVERDDGKVVSSGKVYPEETYINGKSVGHDISSDGFGCYGSEQREKDGIYYMATTYYDFEMPLNPEIRIKIWAEDEAFDFTFHLDNQKVKDVTKEIPLDLAVPSGDKVVIFDKLIITPFDQTITVKNKEEFNWEYYDENEMPAMTLVLRGTDNFGNHVTFEGNPFSRQFNGEKDNENADPDANDYQLNPKVSSYTLRVYDWNKMTPDTLWNENAAVTEPFTIEIPEK